MMWMMKEKSAGISQAATVCQELCWRFTQVLVGLCTRRPEPLQTWCSCHKRWGPFPGHVAPSWQSRGSDPTLWHLLPRVVLPSVVQGAWRWGPTACIWEQ